MGVNLSFAYKAVILSLYKRSIVSKTSFTEVVQFGTLFENNTKKVKVNLSFGHKVVMDFMEY